MLKLSADQQKALDSILSWYKDIKEGKSGTENFITLGGYAGTGKTTLQGILRNELHKKYPKLTVAFCSYTGKAARVLRQKLVEVKAIIGSDSVSTIHSLIYSPLTNSNEEIIGWERKREVEADLIVVDEASMVDQAIWQDLLAYKIPIIAVGDHGQLPPIKGKFNLMQKPQLKLEKIHRQAEENPIIKISMFAREEGKIPVQFYDYNVVKMSKTDDDTRETISELINSYNSDTLLLCGYNHTRVKLNKFVRQSLERLNPEPQAGDRVICLRNNHTAGIFNGMLGTVRTISGEGQMQMDGMPELYLAEVEMDGESKNYKGSLYPPQFNNTQSINFTDERERIGDKDLFDFGYALTVHKSQGSQAKRVILFEERFKQMDDEMWRRWLYTAVTRAEEELFIVGE